MSKVLKSDNYDFGSCGLKTGLYDTAGDDLFTGDVVAVSARTYWDRHNAFDFNGVCTVVSDHDSESDSTVAFVMGLKSVHESFFDGDPVANDSEQVDYRFSTVTQDHAAWVLRKVKGWEDLAHLEKNGGITCYVEEQPC
ncbi:MAG: hypothetical protein ACREBG_02930 [Pyrinomonadaceae bacterium]